MKNTQSELLTQFYQDWINWVDSGASMKDRTFKRITGLCGALKFWCRENNLYLTVYVELQWEMIDQFIAADLNPHWPFDNGQNAYSDAAQCGACHTNPKRIQWVRDRLNQEAKEQS